MGAESAKGVLDWRLAAQRVFMSAIEYVFVVVFMSFIHGVQPGMTL